MTEEAKRLAARAALAELPEACRVGLGTGSTVAHFLEGVAELVRAGRALTGVCTSEATRARAEALGIPILGDEAVWGEGEEPLAIAIDGADEVSRALDLSKGGGGALTREKIVALAARRFVVICDSSKRVERLGESRPIAVEVLRFGVHATLAKLDSLGAARLRERGGAPVVTDGGNYLVDVETGPMDRPEDIDERLRLIPGIVETGLFVGRADLVIVSDGQRVERLVPRLPPRR